MTLPVLTPQPLKSASSRERVWLQVDALFTGEGAPLRDAHLVYDAEAIRYVGTEAPAEGGEPVRLSGYAALPGLVEAHAHLFLEGSPVNPEQRKAYLQKSSSELLDRARERAKKILRHGVMSVRDAGDKHGVGVTLQREADSLPQIESAGTAIHRRGRYGGFLATPFEESESADACVAARDGEAGRWIKLMASGIIDFKKGAVVGPPQMSAREVSAFVEAAHRRGKRVLAHASGAEGIENVLSGGVDTLEHGFFVTPDQLARMRDRRIAWVPTFAPVQAQVDCASELGWDDAVLSGLKRILEGHAESVRRAHAMGVLVLAGSDAGSCGVPHGLGLLRELELLEGAGLSPQAVLTAATGASVIRHRLAPGQRTRIILSRHDPLRSVAGLLKDKILVFDGRVIHEDGTSDAQGL